MSYHWALGRFTAPGMWPSAASSEAPPSTIFTDSPCLTPRSYSTGPVVQAILSWKYVFAFAALEISSVVAIVVLLFDTSSF